MAQSGYTKLALYSSTTPTQEPLNTDLVQGELAINVVDGKLYYKDNVDVVQLLASNDAANGIFTTVTTPNVDGIPSLTLRTNGFPALSFDSFQNGVFNSTGAVTLPIGSTAEEPSPPNAGMLRFNSDTDQFEGYDGTVWGLIGGNGNSPIVENKQIVSSNYVMTTGNNGESVGPMTVDSGVTVTIPADSRWVIL